jgi:hypothetical protein
MKQLFITPLLLVIALVSCKNSQTDLEPIATQPKVETDNTFAATHPDMEYVQLDKTITHDSPSYQLDVDGDQVNDLRFVKLYVGDPLEKVDKLQFRVSGIRRGMIPVNHEDEVPIINQADLIPVTDFDGNMWYPLSSSILIERVEDVNGAISWRGNWVNATNKFLPFQIVKDNLRYNGWVELSVNTAKQQLVLHRAAVSKTPEKAIKAGQ